MEFPWQLHIYQTSLKYVKIYKKKKGHMENA